jgi:hypothetical protein
MGAGPQPECWCSSSSRAISVRTSCWQGISTRRHGGKSLLASAPAQKRRQVAAVGHQARCGGCASPSRHISRACCSASCAGAVFGNKGCGVERVACQQVGRSSTQVALLLRPVTAGNMIRGMSPTCFQHNCLLQPWEAAGDFFLLHAFRCGSTSTSS